MSTLRAEFFWDGESTNWHFRVPALRINGGGAATREDAERGCLEAIAYTLEGNPSEYDSAADAISLDVVVATSAA